MKLYLIYFAQRKITKQFILEGTGKLNMDLNSLVNMLRLGTQKPLNIIFNNTLQFMI